MGEEELVPLFPFHICYLTLYTASTFFFLLHRSLFSHYSPSTPSATTYKATKYNLHFFPSFQLTHNFLAPLRLSDSLLNMTYPRLLYPLQYQNSASFCSGGFSVSNYLSESLTRAILSWRIIFQQSQQGLPLSFPRITRKVKTYSKRVALFRLSGFRRFESHI